MLATEQTREKPPPPSYPPLLEKGIRLRQARKWEEALACFNQHLAENPGHKDTHFSRAVLHFLRGELEKAWPDYEYRLHDKPAAYRFTKPRWQGEDVRGKNIFVYAEQGFGDCFQFIRYLPLLKARGAHITYKCQPATAMLLDGHPAIDQLVPFCAADLVGIDYDYHAPLLSLPLAFGTTLATIPAEIPYLTAPQQKAAEWRQKLAAYKGRKIGLVWAGSATYINDHFRSMKLGDLAPLAAVEGVHFFALQKGEAAAQAASPSAGMEVISLGDQLQDFSDTAGLLEALDLVISVDTGIVHLAGALGRPVWAMLAQTPDWRWMLDRKDSPWYPTLRLFRQHTLGKWESVAAEVANALGQLPR